MIDYAMMEFTRIVMVSNAFFINEKPFLESQIIFSLHQCSSLSQERHEALGPGFMSGSIDSHRYEDFGVLCVTLISDKYKLEYGIFFIYEPFRLRQSTSRGVCDW